MNANNTADSVDLPMRRSAAQYRIFYWSFISAPRQHRTLPADVIYPVHCLSGVHFRYYSFSFQPTLCPHIYADDLTTRHADDCRFNVKYLRRFTLRTQCYY